MAGKYKVLVVVQAFTHSENGALALTSQCLEFDSKQEAEMAISKIKDFYEDNSGMQASITRLY